MHATFSRLLPAFVVALAATVSASAADDLKVGDEAPDFTLKGSDGKSYHLADFRGKKAVVIAWFPKAFTQGCTAQCTSYSKDAADLKKLDVAYFTASVDPVDQNTKFAESLNADFPILSDPDKAVAKAYGVLRPDGGVTNRWTFYVDKQGVLRKIDKDIKAAQAAPDTLKTLKELGLDK